MSSSSPSGQQGACSGAKATGGAVTKEGKSGQARGRPHQVSLRDDHVLLPGALAGASLPAATHSAAGLARRAGAGRQRCEIRVCRIGACVRGRHGA
jgi:hypothetical protein